MSSDPRDPGPFVEGDESFTLTLGAAGGAAVMASALSRKLAKVATRGERYIVIVALEDHGWHYTQCMIDPDGACIEAVSNEYIEPAELRLGLEQESILADLGFEPPDDDSPNHHREMEHPVAWDVVADLLTIPLVAVYGADRHDRVRVEVFPGFDHMIARPPTGEPATRYLIPGQPTGEEVEALVTALKQQASKSSGSGSTEPQSKGE